MAREKNTVDYFPFYVKDGKTIFALQEKYGEIAGVGYFTQLFRYLSQIPEHWINYQDEYEQKRFVKFMGGDESICIHIVYIMCATGKLDKTLWETKGVIVSKDFLDSLEKVYSRRSKTLNIEIIRKKTANLPDFNANTLYTSCKHIVKKSCIKERKGKERKGKERKGKENCDSSESPLQKIDLQIPEKDKAESVKSYLFENWKYLEFLFREKQDYDNWGKQRKHVKSLDKRIQITYRARAPDMTLKEFTEKVVAFFWWLKTKSSIEIWKKQAFFPSTLNAERIWTMFLEEIEKRKKPTKQDYLRGIE